MSDTVLGGWSGSPLDPFGLTNAYVDPGQAYDANWFDPSTTMVTINIEGTDLTTSLTNWSNALNGETVTIDGTEYNFGSGQADIETRLDILAAFEVAVLETHDYLPMLQDGSMALLSQQVYYIVEEYNPVMGRGGIEYLKYNYSEEEWDAYLVEQGGELKY